MNWYKLFFYSLLCLGSFFSKATAPHFAGLVKRISSQAVSIYVKTERFKTGPWDFSAYGAGFVVDPSGVIATCAHILEKEGDIFVSFANEEKHPATIIALDETIDLALLRVTPPFPLQAVTWSDGAALEVGDWVLAFGNPYGLGKSVSAGLIAAKDRLLPGNNGGLQVPGFIQTDAPLSLGSSGGPLVTLDGKVAGMVSRLISPGTEGRGAGFAVPARFIKEAVDFALRP